MRNERAKRVAAGAGLPTGCACPSTRTSELGFTLMDLLVVLVLMVVITAMSVTLLNQALPDWRLSQAASTLASSLRAARAKAILDREQVMVPIDVKRCRYTRVTRGTALGIDVETDEDGEDIAVVNLPLGVSFARPDGTTTVTITPIGSSDQAVVFGPKGLLLAPTTPGYVYLGNEQLDIYRRVTVSIVGTVKVERWKAKGWE